MENLVQKLLFGTHVIACKTQRGIVIPEFYREGLIHKNHIIEAYRDFAPIYDLTLNRTYQIIFPEVECDLIGLPIELGHMERFDINKLVFDNSFGIQDVFSVLDGARRIWFINELYQLLCLERGLYPAKNYGESNEMRHPYILFEKCEFTKKIDFEYDSIDEYVSEYYRNREKVYTGGKTPLSYILHKSDKLPKTKSCLFRAMYCKSYIGHNLMSEYYHKKDKARNEALRKLDAMMKRRVKRYGLITD